MDKPVQEQMDLPFGESRTGTPRTESKEAGSGVTSLTARIEATRSAERKGLYRAILSRAAHLLSSDDSSPGGKRG